jgi:hypothetical protein
MRSLATFAVLLPLVFARPQASGDEVSHLARDYRTVLDFAKKVTVDPNGIIKGWNGTDVCKFEGFSCAENPSTGQQALAGVDLNGAQLAGDRLTLGGFLDKLTDLAFFHANSNGFLGQVPADLSNLHWLYELDLSNNKLSGPFPSGILTATNLTWLDLRFNQFHGPLPAEIFKMDLDVLFLNNNAFSGLLPNSIGSTPARYLTLANNKFQGRIPTTIGDAKNLEQVILSGNQISSALPAELANIKNLTILDVGDNQLAGQVPETLCQIPTLQVFNVSNNFFSKPLGPACQVLLEKKILDISANCIKGAKNQKTDCSGVY